MSIVNPASQASLPSRLKVIDGEIATGGLDGGLLHGEVADAALDDGDLRAVAGRDGAGHRARLSDEDRVAR